MKRNVLYSLPSVALLHPDSQSSLNYAASMKGWRGASQIQSVKVPQETSTTTTIVETTIRNQGNV
jgi:hypothetical protein